MSFWKTATTEAKLAQIDGGISLGMTAKQVGMNCGTTGGAVRAFAIANGRHFHGQSAAGKRRQTEAGLHGTLRRASERYGWSMADGINAAIFPKPSAESLFDPHPYEEV